MTRLSYKKALDRALEPLGFIRRDKPSGWFRMRGEIQDWVNLQKSWIDGSVTINLYAMNLETQRMLLAIDCEITLETILFGKRIRQLVDG